MPVSIKHRSRLNAWSRVPKEMNARARIQENGNYKKGRIDEANLHYHIWLPLYTYVRTWRRVPSRQWGAPNLVTCEICLWLVLEAMWKEIHPCGRAHCVSQPILFLRLSIWSHCHTQTTISEYFDHTKQENLIETVKNKFIVRRKFYVCREQLPLILAHAITIWVFPRLCYYGLRHMPWLFISI